MTKDEQKLMLSILELMLNVGVPAAIKAIQSFSVSVDPSAEEIRDLSEKLKPVNEYWNG